MEKEFYTYEKILLSLYKEYVNNQKLLNELKQYISIDDDKVKDFYFKSYLKHVRKNRTITDKRILLVVEEKLSKIKKIQESLLFLDGYFKDNHSLYYNILNSNDQSILDINHIDKLVSIKPNIEITDNHKFTELIREILNTRFMNLEETITDNRMIDNWRLDINSSNLLLRNNSKSINYDPYTNTINLYGISNGTDFYSIVRGDIPGSYINNSTRCFLDENESNKIFELDNCDFLKETSFSLEESNKVLRLKSKK